MTNNWRVMKIADHPVVWDRKGDRRVGAQELFDKIETLHTQLEDVTKQRDAMTVAVIHGYGEHAGGLRYDEVPGVIKAKAAQLVAAEAVVEMCRSGMAQGAERQDIRQPILAALRVYDTTKATKP